MAKGSRSVRFWTELWKKQLWVFALSCLGFFTACPVYLLMWLSRWDQSQASLAEKQREFYEMVAGRWTANSAKMQPFMLIVIGLSVLTAWNCFSYLHSRSKSDLYDALPVRREKLFTVKLMIALSDYLLPALAGMLLFLLTAGIRSVLTGKAVREIALTWLIGLIYFLMIFLIASLAMILTGRTLAAVLGTFVLLGIGPFLSVLKNGYGMSFYHTLYHQSRTGGFGWKYLNPVLQAIELVSSPRQMRGRVMIANAAVLCLILGLICLFLIRIRRAEAAGNAMAFAAAGEGIKIILSAAASLTAGLLFYDTFQVQQIHWLVFGLIFGWLVSYAVIQMIYHMDIRMIFAGHWSLLAAGVIAFGTASFFFFDLSGHDRYLPKKDQIDQISFSVDSSSLAWNSSIGYDVRLEHGLMSCDENSYELLKNLVEGSARFNRDIAGPGSVPGQSGRKAASKSVLVKLKNGKTYYRTYNVWSDEVRTLALKLYDNELFKECTWPILAVGPDQIKDLVLSWQTSYSLVRSQYRRYSESLSSQERQEVSEALLEDLREVDGDVIGSEIPLAELDYVADLTGKGFGDGINDGEQFWRGALYVYPSFTRTIKALEKAGYTNLENPSTADGYSVTRIVVYPEENSEDAYMDQDPARVVSQTGTVYTDPEKIAELLPQIVLNYYTNDWLVCGEYVNLFGTDPDMPSSEEEVLLDTGRLLRGTVL